MRFLVLPMLVLSLAAATACSSNDDSSSTNGKTSASASACAADTRKDIYTAGLMKPAGTLSVELVDSNPGPPIKGTNTMTIQVFDAAKAPIDGAAITVTPWMPDHAHGSAVKPSVTPIGGGKYTIDNIYLVMAGLWQIKIDVQPAAGGAQQEALFQFCLDG